MTAFKALDAVWVLGSEATGLIEWGFESPPMIAGDEVWYVVLLDNPQALWPYRTEKRLIRGSMLRLIG